MTDNYHSFFGASSVTTIPKVKTKINMKTAPNKELTWIARVLSGLVILFSLSMFITYQFFPEHAGMQPGSGEPLKPEEMIGLSIAGLGLLGLGLAWKWELFGGLFALVAFVVLVIMEPMLFQSGIGIIYPGCALLFLVLWAKNKNLF